MAGVLMTTLDEPKASPETSRTDVRVEDGPWAISIVSSSYANNGTGAQQDVSAFPRIEYSVYMSGKQVEKVGGLDISLLNPGWDRSIRDATKSCVNYLRKRSVLVPDQFPLDLESALVTARKRAILLVIRHQAASLIEHVSADEACHEWALAEAKLVMSS